MVVPPAAVVLAAVPERSTETAAEAVHAVAAADLNSPIEHI